MRKRPGPALAKTLLALLMIFGAQESVVAQQGHPLVGSWSGYWGPNAEQSHRVLLLLQYDGDEITGVINPGPNSAPLTEASLDPSTWTVILEADGRDGEGNVVHYRVEGMIENLTSPTERAIVGTWVQGAMQGDFRVTLN